MLPHQQQHQQSPRGQCVRAVVVAMLTLVVAMGAGLVPPSTRLGLILGPRPLRHRAESANVTRRSRHRRLGGYDSQATRVGHLGRRATPPALVATATEGHSRTQPRRRCGCGRPRSRGRQTSFISLSPFHSFVTQLLLTIIVFSLIIVRLGSNVWLGGAWCSVNLVIDDGAEVETGVGELFEMAATNATRAADDPLLSSLLR